MSTSADSNIIRRSVYQNSNTLVEVLIRSKRGSAAGRRGAPALTHADWPPAVPVAKDGRPVSRADLADRRSVIGYDDQFISRDGRPVGRGDLADRRSVSGDGDQLISRDGRPAPLTVSRGQYVVSRGGGLVGRGSGALSSGRGGMNPSRGGHSSRGGRAAATRGGSTLRQNGMVVGRGDNRYVSLPPAPPPPSARPPAGVQSRARHGQQTSVPAARCGPDADQSLLEEQFDAWTRQLHSLVHDIKTRPATAHVRPLLERLEATLRTVPTPPAREQQQQQWDDLERKFDEVQHENQLLRSRLECVGGDGEPGGQSRYAAAVQPSGAGDGRPTVAGDGAAPRKSVGDGDRGADTDTEQLTEVKRHLAKYRKYASRLNKTKENLLAQIDTMAQEHSADLRRLREEHAAELEKLRQQHETDVNQLATQLTSDTHLLATFRSDAEAVRLSLEDHVRQKALLQHALADRDLQISQLTQLNRDLQALGRRATEELSAPQRAGALGEVTSKLQLPPSSSFVSAAAVAADGAGDRRQAAAPTHERSVSLDVTLPAPPRPFLPPGPDVSLGSLLDGAGPEPSADAGAGGGHGDAGVSTQEAAAAGAAWPAGWLQERLNQLVSDTSVERFYPLPPQTTRTSAAEPLLASP